jgi:hypothetical protein
VVSLIKWEAIEKVTCSWSRAFETKVKNFDFNIRDKKCFILMAYGPISGGLKNTNSNSNF